MTKVIHTVQIVPELIMSVKKLKLYQNETCSIKLNC